MPSFDQPWRPEIDWTTEAGRLIDRLIAALPRNAVWNLIIFDSSPLQLGLDRSFLSGDVDVISTEDISGHCQAAGLLKGQSPVYIEPCSAAAFTASPDWFTRAFQCERQHARLTFPHPIDILVSKIKRLEEKDLNAFRMVITKTGHPTEEELLIALRRVVDVYRPSFDEESAGNPIFNTQTLWAEIFKKPIDVRQAIIAPALAARRKNYAGAGTGLKRGLDSL